MAVSIPISQGPTSIATALDSISAPSAKGPGWDEIVRRLETQIQKSTAPSSPGGSTGAVPGVAQLGEMMKLQVDVHRAQMRVELLSKVSESAMAAMRKLQQNQ